MRRGGKIVLQGAVLYKAGARGILWDALLELVDCKLVRREEPLIPGRKFLADLLWPAHGVAVEVQGGIHTGGHHVRGPEYENDCRKILYAAANHVLVLPITYDMLAHELEETAEALNKILDCREPSHRTNAHLAPGARQG